MLSGWMITFASNYVFSRDRKLYKLPFRSGLKWYEAREIKQDKKNKRWRINGVYWSWRQLKKHVIIDQIPYLIFPFENEYPF